MFNRIEKVLTAIRHPDKLSQHIRRNIIFGSYTYYHRNIRGRKGIDVMAQDWDNLIILDACRYDVFEQVNDISGELTDVISKGSDTGEFLNENFSGTYHDTVYVSANPTVDRVLNDDQFHSIVRPWQTHWNEEKGTVLPSDMADVTKKTHDDFPNKRIISHFIQPHQPLLGETGQQIYDNQRYGSTIQGHRQQVLGRENPEWKENIYLGLFSGEIDNALLWKAYKENLELTLPYVEDLIGELRGKTVITSDHGNIFEQPFIRPTATPSAHPGGIYLEKLVRVPWLTIESNNRKEIVSEAPRETSEEVSMESVSNRLQKLGYLEE